MVEQKRRERERERERETERQTDRETERHTDRDRQTDRERHPGKTYRQTEEDAKKHLSRERILAVPRRRNFPKAIEVQVATSETVPESRDSWPLKDLSIEDSPIVLHCPRRFRHP